MPIKKPEISPKILEMLKNKQFGPSDIKWIKTINDSSTGNLSSSNAYLYPDPRVIKDNDGIFFCLQVNQRFEMTLLKPEPGDLILLYQKLEDQTIKCFTHLVTPVDDKVVPCPYSGGGWNGRWVKVIAMTQNKAIKSIEALTADWEKMPFRSFLSNLSFPNGAIWEIANEKLFDKPLSNKVLSDLQKYIMPKFEKWKQ